MKFQALALLTVAGLLAGCASDMNMSMEDSGSYEPPTSVEDTDFSDIQLRIDVLPTVSEDDDLIAQSFWLEDLGSNWKNVILELQPTIEISGNISGFAANPYGIQVPGSSDVPVDGQVTLYRPDTIVTSTVQTIGRSHWGRVHAFAAG